MKIMKSVVKSKIEQIIFVYCLLDCEILKARNTVYDYPKSLSIEIVSEK